MKVARLLVLPVVGIAVAAGCLYGMQGGFGAGHGQFDVALVALGLPWTLLPFPGVLTRHDYWWLILWPLALNLVAVCVALLGMRLATMWGFKRRGWFALIALMALYALLVAGELIYTRNQVASGSGGEELHDAWVAPFGTALVLGGCVVLAKGRGWVRLAAGLFVLFGLVVCGVGFVLVTRW